MTLRRKRELTCFSIAVMCLGLLIWARLLLVTNYHRTAMAQPPAKPAAPQVAK